MVVGGMKMNSRGEKVHTIMPLSADTGDYENDIYLSTSLSFQQLSYWPEPLKSMCTALFIFVSVHAYIYSMDEYACVYVNVCI